MESNWRLNVWDVGWSGGPFRFAGKLRVPIPVPFPPGVVQDYILYGGGTPNRPFYGIATDTSLYTNAPGLLFWYSSIPDQTFPGPFDVFPD